MVVLPNMLEPWIAMVGELSVAARRAAENSAGSPDGGCARSLEAQR